MLLTYEPLPAEARLAKNTYYKLAVEFHESGEHAARVDELPVKAESGRNAFHKVIVEAKLDVKATVIAGELWLVRS